MKKYFFLLFLLSSCTSDKIYNKQLYDDVIQIDWYHYSYITSGSPNYITVNEKGKKHLILKMGFGLQDINLNKDTIVISHLKFQIKPEVKKDKVFGYKIKYKEVTSHEMYLKYENEVLKKKQADTLLF